jgi:hypothetical protein
MQSKWVTPFFVCSPIRIFHLMLKRPKTETLPSTLQSKDNKAGDMFLHNTATVQILKHIHHFSAVILDRVYFISNQTEQFDVKIFNEAKLREILRASQQIECKANGLLLSLFALQLESFI